MRYKNLFIDLDDTIWDFQQNGQESVCDIYYDYGFDKYYATFEDFYDVYRPNNIRLWTLYHHHKIKKDELIIERFLAPLREFGINDVDFARKLNDDLLDRLAYKSKLVDGAIDLLDYLKPKYRLFILSNGFTEVQHRKINNSGLNHYFERIILSEDAGVNKPNKEIFTYALINTNSKRMESIMIGDSFDADITGARNSRIDQLWFNPKQETAQEFTPSFTVKKLEEIKNIL